MQLGSSDVEVVAVGLEVVVGSARTWSPGTCKRAMEEAQKRSGVVFMVASVLERMWVREYVSGGRCEATKLEKALTRYEVGRWALLIIHSQRACPCRFLVARSPGAKVLAAKARPAPGPWLPGAKSRESATKNLRLLEMV